MRVFVFLGLLMCWSVACADSSERPTRTVDISNGDSQTLMFDHGKVPLDLSPFAFMAIDVSNEATASVTVDIKYFGPQKNHVNQGRCFVPAGQSKSCLVVLNRYYEAEGSPWKKTFGQLRGLPGKYVMHWNGFDLTEIRRTEVSVSVESDTSPSRVIVSEPYGHQVVNPDDFNFDKQPRPILDEFGQFVGADWPGKIKSAEELAEQGRTDLEKYLRADFNETFSRFGGWAQGPRQEATGYFYTKKLNGKWWFVDPVGYLFWSLGVDGVNRSTTAPIEGREAFLPRLDHQEIEAYRAVFRNGGIDFIMANKVRKYGKKGQSIANEVNIGRLKSWGINTLGAWSAVDHQGKHPYTLIIHPDRQGMGEIEKMVDPFSSEYLSNLRSRLKAISKHNEDPWLLGVFINNELHWNGEFEIPNQVLSVDSDVPARKAMNRFLKDRYPEISTLNGSWGSNFTSYEEIEGKIGEDFNEIFNRDMLAFLKFYANEYYRVTAEEMRKVFPNHLYLGSRLHGRAKTNRPVQEAASKYCDVVSFNIYEYSPGGFEPLFEEDKPAIIGEFHFGTASHGVWGTGLRAAYDLDNQKALYERYIRDAARHPSFVGAHWFIFQDQLAIGRFDGENFRIGVLSVVDVPYRQMVEGIENAAAGMYAERGR